MKILDIYYLSLLNCDIDKNQLITSLNFGFRKIEQYYEVVSTLYVSNFICAKFNLYNKVLWGTRVLVSEKLNKYDVELCSDTRKVKYNLLEKII
jgi:hypothetical protein